MNYRQDEIETLSRAAEFIPVELYLGNFYGNIISESSKNDHFLRKRCAA